MAGNTGLNASNAVAAHHVSVLTEGDILRQFWEVKEKSITNSTLTQEERIVLNHYQARFVVPLPKRTTANQLGESRTQAVRRFISFERSLHANGQFKEFEKVIF